MSPFGTADATERSSADVRESSSNGSGLLVGLSWAFEHILVVVALLVVAAWLFAAFVHVGDRALVFWADGARIGVANAARDGTLYPPLFDGTSYGGTRFMPVPILLHAGLSLLTGELLSSGKLGTYLSFTALAVAMFLAMRSLGCRPLRSLALIAAVVATHVAVGASLSVSHDALPVALQLFALLVIGRSRTRTSAVVAAVLCSLALFSKLSALWGFAAIAVWLWRRNRSLLAPFIGVSIAACATLLAIFQVASNGRFVDNLIALSGSGVEGGGLARLGETLYLAVRFAPLLYALLPLAGIEIATAIRRANLSVFHLALIFSVPITLIVLTDAGASSNHLLDVMCLETTVVAGLWSRASGNTVSKAVVPIAASLALVAALPSALAPLAVNTLEQAVSGRTIPAYDIDPLEGVVHENDRVLSEDASIPISLGQVPVVLDPFMLLRIGERHPEWLDPLVQRIERQEFDVVVLESRIGEAPADWYTEQHFGPRVIEAIRRNYVFLEERAEFAVYGRRER